MTYIDRARPEYEPLLILTFFRGPHGFRWKKIFFTRFRKNSFGKIIFFGKFFKIAEIYFEILFLHSKFVLETYFLSMISFAKAANKLEALKTIYYQLSKTFLCFRNRFPKQFYNNSSGFPTWFWANQDIRKPWKPAKKFVKFLQKIEFFENDFSLTGWRNISSI